MPEQLAGFPYWQFEFGEAGQRVAVPNVNDLAADLQAAGVTDLFVFSHGWNNSKAVARDLYTRFFQQVAAVASTGAQSHLKPNVTLGVAGVIWPSMRWADEPAPGSGSPVGAGGAAGLGRAVVPSAAIDDALLVRQLKDVYTDPAQRSAIDEMADLLHTRSDDSAELKRFQQLMGTLMPAPATAQAPEDEGQRALVQKDHREVFSRMATAGVRAGVAPGPAGGGAARGSAAGVRDTLGRLWDGARQALREATYWEMKERAGVVGEQGLGPLIGDLHEQAPAVRIHLIGHSFGARLVSFTLKGLPPGSEEAASPVKSLTLLQGAFSHFSFAPALPQDPSKSGALNGMAERVNGPLVASFSEHDTAVGVLYPAASIAAGQNASALGDPLYPWGAMGHDGAQAVHATVVPYDYPGASYPFAAGKFLNLNGNDVIVAGAPPSGAHGDIFHPEIAWAALAAAALVDPSQG